MMKLVSFDLDGTLLDKANFDYVFWFEEVPRLYAKQHKITFDKALETVKKEYNKIGKNDINWYLPSFWFKNFGLKEDPKKIMLDMKNRIKFYPDAIIVLKELSKKFPLIILTHSSKEMVDIKIKTENIDKYFKMILSVVDDLKTIKKAPEVYRYILNHYKLKPSELVHVGDDWEFDYVVPRKLGIKAFYLDREGKKKHKNSIRSLIELVKIMMEE